MKIRRDQIKSIFKNELNIDVDKIIPCGNHDLNRNLVFKVYSGENKWIIKLYYKPMKREREINSLAIFFQEELKILATGDGKEGEYAEWTIYTYVDGVLLEDIYHLLSSKEREQLFFEIGKRMGKLHSSTQSRIFGDWCKERQSSIEKYKDFIIDDTERLIANINKSKGDKNRKIFEDAINLTRNEYKNIRELKNARLCHRDLDGRNILVNRIESNENLSSADSTLITVAAFLDFEKCVLFNEHFDIISFYRKYFLKEPRLLEPFKMGYEEYLKIEDSFNRELRYNLLRTGIDLCSWANEISVRFYEESVLYLEKVLYKYDNIEEFYI